MKNIQKTSFTYKLTDIQQVILKDILYRGNYREVHVKNALVAAETEKCRICLYRTGKCLVQGKGAQDFVTFVLEPQILQHVQVGYEETLNQEMFAPHMGIDESGKGDFFGPLVIASVYTDRFLTKKMLAMDIKESKRITSDNKAISLSADIRKLLKQRYAIVSIGSEAYNRLYARMKNVNRILAWGHARAIENLLARLPSCRRAVSDQFGSKQQVEQALMHRGRKIELIQKHKAESDIAVAAASVLARATFLTTLRKMEKEFGIHFLKGASSQVLAAGKQLLDKHGPQVLLKTAKCHFKTTDMILDTFSLKRSILGSYGAVTSKAQDKTRTYHHSSRSSKATRS